jgi:prepilin peptidase CpaA
MNFPIERSYLLGLIVLIAAISDLMSRKVYNWLTYPAMGLGLVLNLYLHQGPGLFNSGLGLLLGGLLFFPAFYWGGMGAGDIKLMAAIGALMGWQFVLATALYTAFIGGIVAIIYVIIHGELLATLQRVFYLMIGWMRKDKQPPPLLGTTTLPYAVIIALGTIAAFLYPSSNWFFLGK